MLKIKFATPIVWANYQETMQFIQNMDVLIDCLRRPSFGCGKMVSFDKASIDIFSIQNETINKPFNNLDLKALNISEDERNQKGMAHWWFSTIERAFLSSPQTDYIFYYPFDTNWEVNSQNTVSNPSRICQILTWILGQNHNEESLYVGNYISSNSTKETIEYEVRNFLVYHYPQLNSDIKRVRSEFFIISRRLFTMFAGEIKKDNSFPKAEDPALLLILYCLKREKTIRAFDLGKYHVQGVWDSKKKTHQITRAKDIIVDFKKGNLPYV